MKFERWHKTAPAGERLYRPYASHGAKRTDDHDDDDVTFDIPVVPDDNFLCKRFMIHVCVFKLKPVLECSLVKKRKLDIVQILPHAIAV